MDRPNKTKEIPKAVIPAGTKIKPSPSEIVANPIA